MCIKFRKKYLHNFSEIYFYINDFVLYIPGLSILKKRRKRSSLEPVQELIEKKRKKRLKNLGTMAAAPSSSSILKDVSEVKAVSGANTEFSVDLFNVCTTFLNHFITDNNNKSVFFKFIYFRHLKMVDILPTLFTLHLV